METQSKTKLSSSFIVVKLFFIAAIIAFPVSVYVKRDSVDAKTMTAFAIVSVVFSALVIYFFTRPIIYYDLTDLFIKKIGAKESVIPLKNIRTISRDYAYRGSANYTITYSENKESKSIRLSKNYPSKPMMKFTSFVRQVNPHLETKNM
jgi:hypothetical protein